MDILAEINRVMELEGRTLTRLRECVGPAYEEAVRLIYACPGKVIVTGMGKSGLIAQKIASTVVSTGTPAMLLHPAEAMHGDIGIAHKDDVLLAISKSGESDELIGLLPTIRRIGAWPWVGHRLRYPARVGEGRRHPVHDHLRDHEQEAHLRVRG